LQLRLGSRARTTKDIDISLELSRQNVGLALTVAAAGDLGDWFSFLVRQDPDPLPGLAGGGWRFAVTGLVDGRLFESFRIDVGLADPVLEPADALTTPPLLAFAGLAPLTVPCYPLSQHLAEKVHALMYLAHGTTPRLRTSGHVHTRICHAGQTPWCMKT
jgi:hypothetical protein